MQNKTSLFKEKSKHQPSCCSRVFSWQERTPHYAGVNFPIRRLTLGKRSTCYYIGKKIHRAHKSVLLDHFFVNFCNQQCMEFAPSFFYFFGYNILLISVPVTFKKNSVEIKMNTLQSPKDLHCTSSLVVYITITLQLNNFT